MSSLPLNTLQRLARIEALLSNAGIVKRNRLQMSNNTGAPMDTRQKQVAGDGIALAAPLAPPNVVIPAPQGNPQVGDIMTPTIDIYALTHAPILGLIQFYNEDFGIATADTVSVRAQKVFNWLTEDVF
ncbi:hypothetical protein C8F01DRAFT_1242216 [Mycena amicta]|nr:hypothetical protein C8F01DRAFT_1242216 [Mycena amicta]